MAVALRLARAGYWAGDPQKVLDASADIVMAALQYEAFRDDYERTFIEMNRERK